MDDEPKNKLNDKIGDLFLDLAKLVFAGLILGSILDAKIPKYIILGGGAVGMGILTCIAFIFFTRSRS